MLVVALVTLLIQRGHGGGGEEARSGVCAGERRQLERSGGALVTLPRGFTSAECRRIISLANGTAAAKGATHSAGSRASVVQWLDPARPSVRWVYEKLERLVRQADEEVWEFGVSPPTDHLQLATYGPGDHYDWHVDAASAIEGVSQYNGRAISVTVQLSVPSAYDGGGLQVGLELIGRSVGTVAMFPSTMMHKVHTVRRGQRSALVAWFQLRERRGGRAAIAFWAKAIDDTRLVQRAAPHMPFASYSLGLLLWGAREYSAAQASLERAVSLAPDLAAPRNNLAILLLQRPGTDNNNDAAARGRQQYAKRLLRRALTLEPADSTALLSLAMAQHFLSERREAEAAYRRAIRQQPALWMAYNNLAMLLESSNDGVAHNAQAAALRVLERGLRANPAHWLMRRNYIRMVGLRDAL